MESTTVHVCIKAEPGLMDYNQFVETWTIAPDAPHWGPELAEGEWGYFSLADLVAWNTPTPTWDVDEVADLFKAKL
jgi:hypothetical protein